MTRDTIIMAIVEGAFKKKVAKAINRPFKTGRYHRADKLRMLPAAAIVGGTVAGTSSYGGGWKSSLGIGAATAAGTYLGGIEGLRSRRKREAKKKLKEGYIKDVLTYDVSQHHPRPGRRAKHMRPAGSSRSASSPPLGRHDPKKFYPTATSSAARKPGSAPKGKSKVGKRLAMFAAPYAAIGVYKGYKSLRDRVEVHKMLRKAKKQNSPKESVVEMKMGRPYTLASNRRISFRRKPVRWPFRKPFEMGAPTGLTREMHQRGDIRVIESMDKERLIEAIIEVFDDRYSASVFSKDRRKKQQGALLRKARKLKARAARKKYTPPDTPFGDDLYREPGGNY